MTNVNCLENIKCPVCGNEDSFRIAGTSIFTVTDDGTEDHGDIEWDDDSYAECTQCLRHGTLKNFMVITPPTSITVTDAAVNRHGREFAEIARKHLFIETLEVRKSDRLDFHNVSVWGVADALKAAFNAGAACVDAPAKELLDALQETVDLLDGCMRNANRLRQNGFAAKIGTMISVNRAVIARATNARRQP